ncbi:MAG: branched-chain amino acid ABC transporter permease [Lachnospiraceae bacterium]|nr:branched-chain amino acid ABC transporter permease [Lachnospiraceae bacterium]
MKNSKLTKQSKDNLGTIAMVVIIYIIVQICSAAGLVNSHLAGLLVPLCVYATMAVALNLVVGILGELSLGHAGFMCVGAFSAAFFSVAHADTMNTFPRFIIAILIGGLIAGIFGFLIGIPVLRLNGDYLAIVTLAFGEIIKNIMNVLYIGMDEKGYHFSMKSANDLTMTENGKMIINGPQGITGTPYDATFTAGFIILLIAVIVVLNLINSRDGRAIMAIRDNRIAAESVGIPVTRYKMLAFTMSAVISGCAGALYAHNLASLIATPARFGYNMSILFLVFVVLGGIGSTRGAIIASIILTIIPEVLRFIGDFRLLIYSIVMIVMMIVNWNPKSRAFIEAHNPFKKKEKEVK